jgi:Cu-Zn family superoxide dismutase
MTSINAIAIFDPNSSFNKNKIKGSVQFHQCCPEKKTIIKVNLSGFIPNSKNAIHIHEKGITSLENACDSTCKHYNPYNTKHGNKYIHGKNRHVGDLINNIESDKDGNVHITFIDDLVSLTHPFSVIGRSVVIHSEIDDLGIYRDENSERGRLSSITGNAGGRIACSVIGLM